MECFLSACSIETRGNGSCPFFLDVRINNNLVNSIEHAPEPILRSLLSPKHLNVRLNSPFVPLPLLLEKGSV